MSSSAACERVSQRHQDVLLLLLPDQHHAGVFEVEPPGHALAPDAREAFAVPVLHSQHYGDHEQAEADRDGDQTTKIAPTTIRLTGIPSPPEAGCRARSIRRAG